MKESLYFNKKFIFNKLFLQSTFVKNKWNLFSKKISIPLFTVCSYFIFEYFRNNNKKIHCQNLIQKNENINLNKKFYANNYLILGEPEIIIFYDDTNKLQCELSEIVLNKLVNYINILHESNKIKIRKVMINNLNNNEKEIFDKFSNEYNQKNNEPLLIIKNDLCLESINPISFTNTISKENLQISQEIKFKTLNKLNNLLLYKTCDNLSELRNEFNYLQNAKNNIIVVPYDSNENKLNFDSKVISLYRNKYTKIILIKNEKLKENLKLKNGHIYVYYPPRTPYKMRDTEQYLKDYFNQNNMTTILDNLMGEGFDINVYNNSNPISLMLKLNFFRDELNLIQNLNNKDSQNTSEKLIYEKLNSLNFYQNQIGYTFIEREKLQKLLSYTKRNVTKLAEVNKKTIQNDLSIKNQTFLYIHLSSYGKLKDNVLEYILHESNHLFDKIQVSVSKNFSKKNELYDPTQISDELPQIFIIETNNITDKKKYLFSHFSFPEEFEKYLRNKKDPYFRQEEIDNLTYVQTVNSKNFEEKVLKDNSFKEFLIEIKHEGCPTCFYLGKTFDHISQKMKKYNVNNFKMFRTDTHNDLPYLGEFSATPTYLFCRKNDKGQINFISYVDKNELLFKTQKLAKIDLSKIRYHPNIAMGFILYKRNEFLKENYDPDLDLGDFKF